MYFSNMYCYGQDPTLIGVTGIVGCIGVVFVGHASMYAIHIPDNGPAVNYAAGKTFADWVKNSEQNTKAGYLLTFSNGTNRSMSGKNFSTTEDETAAIKKLLKGPTTTIYRIKKHLGPNSGGASANSAAIMIDRVHPSASNPSGAVPWFKQDFGKITWVPGGSAETAQYLARPQYRGAKIPSDMNAGWWRMDADNCNIAVV
jgi:hypothetical protein